MLSGARHDYLAKAGKLVLLLRDPPDTASQRTRNWYRLMHTAVKFGFVGLVGVLVNTVVLILLYRLMHVPLFAASLIAVELSIVSNYLLNDRWTFVRARPSWGRFAKFNLAAAGSLAVTPTVVWLLVHTGVHFLVANLIGIAMGAGLNFAASTLWVWGLPEGGARLCSASCSRRSSSSR